MPEKKTLERARRDKRQGKAASTQAGQFVREEMEHVKEGKHGVKNRKQAVAIGLSKARKEGIPVPKKSAGAAKSPAAKKPAAKKPAAKTASKSTKTKTKTTKKK